MGYRTRVKRRIRIVPYIDTEYEDFFNKIYFKHMQTSKYSIFAVNKINVYTLLQTPYLYFYYYI